MNPQKLVASIEPSLEFARLMKEKGREMPESYFYWVIEKQGAIKPYVSNEPVVLSYYENIPAYTASELGEMLPPYTACHKRGERGDWLCWDNGYDPITEEVGRGETEADARIKMLTHLIQHGHITKV